MTYPPGTQFFPEPDEPVDPALAALLRQVAEQRAQDPLIGARVAAQEVARRLMAALGDRRGVHAESLLCTAGALAGYACQSAVRDLAVLQGVPAGQVFVTVQDAAGRSYLFGDRLNGPLLEDGLSVWSVVAGAAGTLGRADEVPDVVEIVRTVSATLGRPEWGRSLLPAGSALQAAPAELLAAMWPMTSGVVRALTADPALWHVAYAAAAAALLEWVVGHGTLSVRDGVTITMESAIAMSKVVLPAG